MSFLVQVRDSRSLEVLDLNGSPVSFRADSSMGRVEAGVGRVVGGVIGVNPGVGRSATQVSWGRALLHSSLRSFKLPLLGQIFLLAAISMTIGKVLDPPPGQGAAVVVCGALFAMVIFFLWLQLVRRRSVAMA